MLASNWTTNCSPTAFIAISLRVLKIYINFAAEMVLRIA
jgi:hypothetical protein